jgi:hypothetical protein
MRYDEFAEDVAKEVADVVAAIMDGVDFSDIKEVMEAGLKIKEMTKVLSAEDAPKKEVFAAHMVAALSKRVMVIVAPLPDREISA